MSKAHKSEKTIIRDILTIESFKRKFQNIKYVEQFTADVVNRYKSLCREDKIKNNTKNIEKATINIELSTLRSMLKYAYQKKLLDQQKHVNVIKFEEDYKFEGRALTNEEVNKYLEYFEHPYKTAL